MERQKGRGPLLECNISARLERNTYEALANEARLAGKSMSTLVREMAESHARRTGNGKKIRNQA